MSTPALVGIKQDHNLVTYITIHWDGYPEETGRKLLDHYNTKETVEKLMRMGELSRLGERPEEAPVKDPWRFESELALSGKGKDETGEWFDLLYKYCKSYRSRGDADTGARTIRLSDLGSVAETYNYLWEEKNGWSMMNQKGGWDALDTLV